MQMAFNNFIEKLVKRNMMPPKPNYNNCEHIALTDRFIEMTPIGETSTDDLKSLYDLPQRYKIIPAHHLCFRAQKQIVDRLCQRHPNSLDPVTSINRIQKCFRMGDTKQAVNHTYDDVKFLMQEWLQFKEHLIQDLIVKFKEIRRPDIIADDVLIKLVVEQCQRICEDPDDYHRIISEQRAIVPRDAAQVNGQIEVRYEHPVKMPLNRPGDEEPKIIFDAYVSYGEPNARDAWMLVEKLEENGIKLCIPQRDLLIDGKGYVEVTSELIMARCKRTILFITSEFSDSAECKFHAEILFNLSRGNPQKKYVPVFPERFEIPQELDSLKMVSKVNLQRNDAWEWKKLLKTLQAPLDVPRDLYKAED